MRNLAFWVTGALVLTLVVGAAFLDVLGEEEQRWEAEQPIEQADPLVPLIPEQEPVKISPQVVMVPKPRVVHKIVVVRTRPVPVPERTEVHQVRERVIVRERDRARERGKRDPKEPSPPPEPPQDPGNDLVCVLDICVEDGLIFGAWAPGGRS